MQSAEQPVRPVVALVLAAGRGSRLLPHTESLPKCLLDVGGETILGYQLRRFAEAGIAEVHVISGFRADLVAEACRPHAGVQCTENAEWATTNSLCSLALARPLIASRPFVLVNGDVLFHRQILERLLEHPSPSALTLDPTSGRAAEEMSVEVSEGCVAAIAKDLPPERCSGENLGLLKFGNAGGDALFAAAGRLVEGGAAGAWAPRAYNDVIQVEPIHVVDVGGLPWIEIDTAEDLERARAVVFAACSEVVGDTLPPGDASR